jgi:cytochrome c oxidase accessory protein FixG
MLPESTDGPCTGKQPLRGEPPIPENRILSTLHEDGSRRWLYPRVSRGRFLRARRIVAYGLIAIFTLLPYIRIHHKPAILLDIRQRQFTLFGFTFLPTDTLLLALFLVTCIVGICLATALAGRVWCGWMCPQTVYLEFVYRPLERLFDGPPRASHRPGKRATPLRSGLKYALFLVISVYLAHTFLAYFVGVESLAQWVRRSPLEHPVGFLVMLATTGLMIFDFSYFREQTCIVACPYGRFQSVMLDRDSLIVSYDPQRGEPRGKRRRQQPSQTLGDCIDCGLCTDTCPTGIDIRDGLQMECIACAQCIDACDHVMVRIGKPPGLVRYSSQARIAAAPGRLMRPRIVLYPAIIVLLLSLFVFVLANKKTADVTLLRGLGLPFSELAPGEITNQIRVKIKNRSEEDGQYHIAVADGVPAALTASENPIAVAAGQSRTEAVLVTLPRSVFRDGTCEITVRVSDGKAFTQERPYRLLGPQGGAEQPEPGGSQPGGR